MLDPAFGPFLFDTSAETWFIRHGGAAGLEWWTRYAEQQERYISAITIFERVRGYALLARKAKGPERSKVERAREAYLTDPGSVLPVDAAVATVSAEICAMLPEPPSAPKRTHRGVESRAERLTRWRNDTMIAGTALVHDLLLLHNNAIDFEAIRGAIERDPVRFPGLGPLKLMRCESVV